MPAEQLNAFEASGSSPPKKKRVYTEEQKAKRGKANRRWREKNREKCLAAARLRYKKNPEKSREAARLWSKRNTERKRETDRLRRERQSPEEIREYQRLFHSAPPNRRRAADLSRAKSYGLTPLDYDAMVLASTGRCAICDQQDDNSKGGGLVVDHCHETDIVRGLVCGNCNLILGCIEQHDDIDAWMSAAQQYLKHAKQQRLHLVKENV